MKTILRNAVVASLLAIALPVSSHAADEIKAKPWNLAGEELARFDAKVREIIDVERISSGNVAIISA